MTARTTEYLRGAGVLRHGISIINLLAEIADKAPSVVSTCNIYILLPGQRRFKVSHFKEYARNGCRVAVLTDALERREYEWGADHLDSSRDTREVLNVSVNKRTLEIEIRVN